MVFTSTRVIGQLHLIKRAIKIHSMHIIDAYIVFHDVFWQRMEKA